MCGTTDNTNKYLIRDNGYSYDIRRGVLCCGSIISGRIHPLADVETLKARLIEEGYLRQISSDAVLGSAAMPESASISNSIAQTRRPPADYLVVRDIETGPLMAYNLCRAELEKELPDCEISFYADESTAGNNEQTIGDNDETGQTTDDELISAREAWKLWSMYSPGPEFRARIERDSYRITKIIQAEYDRTFTSGKGDGSMSKVEQFVADALVASGAVKTYRRGDAMQHECDIVDEEGGRQIEFVSLFDEKVPPRFRYSDQVNEEESLLLEYMDFGYNVVAQGVINKFTLKNYTDRYIKELAIYMLGPADEGADKIQAMQEMLYAKLDQIRNNYARIHIILHDPLEEESFIYCSNDRYESYPDSLCSTNIITRKTLSEEEYLAKKESERVAGVFGRVDQVQRSNDSSSARVSPRNDNKYIIIKRCIFDPSLRSMNWE